MLPLRKTTFRKFPLPFTPHFTTTGKGPPSRKSTSSLFICSLSYNWARPTENRGRCSASNYAIISSLSLRGAAESWPFGELRGRIILRARVVYKLFANDGALFQGGFTKIIFKALHLPAAGRSGVIMVALNKY